MDILEPANELQDWEVLQLNSVSESVPISSFDEVDSGGLIQANHFSVDAQNIYGQDLDDNKSAESDNPSWVDPALEDNPTLHLNKESCEFWSDSSSERSEDRKFSYFDGRNEMVLQGIREIVEEKGEKTAELRKFYSVASSEPSDFVENPEVGIQGNVKMHDELEVLAKAKNENEEIGSESEVIHENKRSYKVEKRGVAWWKMPTEFLKYWTFGMSPACTVSVAATVVGFLILGRRLFKMKKKTKGIQIMVTVVDDKKASQVTSRAARLNEAFSVVKSVPVIRPSLSAVGMTAWPATSLR